MSTNELACSYAALALADDEVDITADKLNTLIKAAGINEFEPIWATLFAKVQENPSLEAPLIELFKNIWANKDQALEGKNVKDLLLNVGSGGGAAAAPAAGGAAATGGASAEEAKEEEKPKEEGGYLLEDIHAIAAGVLLDPSMMEYLKDDLAGTPFAEIVFTDQNIEKEESDEDMGFGLFD